MAGGTHAFDMIKRLKENENLRKNNYFKAKSAYAKISKAINVEFRSATYSERQEIRRRIIKERRTKKIKAVVALVLSTILTGILLFLFLKFVKA